MHAQPPRTLKRLLKQYGQELIDDPRRTEALLRDHCGQHTREIFVLVNAQKQRVPNELRTAPAWMPREATYTRLSRMLQTKLALTEDAANWAVTSWASALDLDSPPKGEPWSWLPSQLRAPAQTPSRKSRNKKRQNPPSSVQYPKSTSRNAARQTKERSQRAEVGLNIPKLHLTLPAFLWRMPVAWANLLPWIALLTATLFLLAVAYWTSTARELPVVANETTQSGTPVVQSNSPDSEANPVDTQRPVNTNVTPLPELPAPASEYLYKVMPLPAWANVNVTDAPLLVRQEPTTGAPHLGVLQEGAPVSVTAFSRDGLWSQITSPYAGWVSNDFLLFISQDQASSAVRLDAQARRTRDYEVDVRAAPLANAEVTATLSADEAVVVAAVIDGTGAWYQIADPTIGWVAATDLAPPVQ